LKKFIFKLSIFIVIFIILSILVLFIFKPIFEATSLIFPYAIHPFDIVKLYPNTWILIKKFYIISFIVSYIILFHKFSYLLKFPNKTKKNQNLLNPGNELSLLIGMSNDLPICIPEKGLYQNILITGTIGTGKTSSAMYPFTKQLIAYNSSNSYEKLAMLILDVKGNYFEKVLEYANEFGRLQDVISIDLTGNFKYNPLDKPDLKPIVLANRLKTILTLFSPNNSEAYWLDKAEQILAEAIKFCRLYNNGYVSFSEIHKLIMFPEYYSEKLNITKKLFQEGKFLDNEVYDLLTCIDFFEKEFFSLDTRTISILKSEISRITNIFVSDYNVSKTFCPSKKDINFNGFKEVLDKGKIVVLNMNISEYKNLSKIIASYLKLDFQTEVMSRLGKNSKIRKSAFISDEFHEYVTTTDADFFAQSREAKCINIIATQSYTSIKNALKDESATKVIIQNLINKIWFRTDDIFTIEEAQKQIGKEDKEKISTTISENAKETKFNIITNTLLSRDSNLSESYNKYTQNDYIYDTNYFSQILETFKSLAFISNGFRILKPKELQMIPYYKENNMKGFKFNEK
jgi:hypothetical protein